MMQIRAANSKGVYAELQKRLRLRARLPVYRRRVARSQALIRETTKSDNSIVMFSGGKDSTALLGIVQSVVPGIKAAFIDDGAQTPWTYQQIAAMQSAGFDIQTIQTRYTLVEWFQMVGQWGYEGEHKQYDDAHWSTQSIRWLLIDEPAGRLLNDGYTVQILGTRAQESKGRRANRRVRGLVYAKKSGQTIVQPITDWETIDIFTYIVTNDLPLSAEYLQPNDPLRFERRSASTLITDADPIGAKYWLRQRHPDLWQEYTAMFPRLRNRA